MSDHATWDKYVHRHNHIERHMLLHQSRLHQGTELAVVGPESELEPEPVLDTLVLPELDTVVVLELQQGVSPVSE